MYGLYGDIWMVVVDIEVAYLTPLNRTCDYLLDWVWLATTLPSAYTRQGWVAFGYIHALTTLVNPSRHKQNIYSRFRR